MTIQEIKSANEAAGRFFFSSDTMKFFRSRVLSSVFEGKGGIFFLTSERFVGSTVIKPRYYTIRKFNPMNAEISTFGVFNELPLSRALRLARIASEYPEAALEAMKS